MIDVTGPITVTVWDDVEERFMPMSNAVPLKSGDQVKIKAEVPKSSHSTLYVWTSAGELKELNRVEVAKEFDDLQFPIDSNAAAPLTGPAGTEVLLIVSSSGKQPTVEALKKLPLFSVPWPQLPEMSVLRASSK